MRSFIKSFAPAWPTDGSSVDMEARIQGLAKTAEILGLDCEVQVTGKSTAATFAFGESDADTIVNSIVKKFRASYNGETDNVNVSPDQLRDVAMYATSQDPYAKYVRAGATGLQVPAVGGSAIVFNFPMHLPFINTQKENPNQGALSGAQLNRDGRVNLDSGGVALAALNALVLLNGTLNIGSVVIKLFAVIGRRRAKGFCAPTQYIRARAQTQNPDSEAGPLLDELVFETRDPTTLDAITGAISVEVDGDFPVKNTFPSALSAGFVSTTKPGDGRPGLAYDVTINAKRAGKAGRSVLLWVPGYISPDESEVPFAGQYRTFHYPSPGNGTLVYWRIGSIKASKTVDAISDLAQGTPAAGQPLSALAVKGGGSTGSGAMNSDLRDFKAVWLDVPGSA